MAKLTCRVDKYGNHVITELERHTLQSGAFDGNGPRILFTADGGLQRAVDARIAQRAVQDRAVRKDAVVLCEVLVTLCGEWSLELTSAQMYELLKIAAGFLRARYQEPNCVYAAIHTHDDAPHLHFGFVPMTRDGRLSAKRLIDRIELQRLQTELPQYLRSMGYHIERANDKAEPEDDLNRRADCPSAAQTPASQASRLDAAQSRESADLYRDNQNLRLENLLLNRQLKGMVETIKSDPQLELLYMRQLELQTQIKRELHQLHTSAIKA